MLKLLAQSLFCAALLSISALAQTAQTIQPAQPALTDPGSQTVRINLTRRLTTTMGAIAGQKTTFGDWYGVGLDCVPWDWEEFIITTAPQHGRAQVISKDGVLNFPDNNPRKKCNGREIPAKALTYTPDKSYTGEDTMVVQKVSSSGVLETAIYNIMVLRSFENAPEGTTDK